MYQATETEKTSLALATALYRMRLMRATSNDLAIIQEARERDGNESVRDLFETISQENLFETGQRVVMSVNGVTDTGIVRETNCDGAYWYQKVETSYGHSEELFSPAWSVIVEYESGQAFVARAHLTAA